MGAFLYDVTTSSCAMGATEGAPVQCATGWTFFIRDLLDRSEDDAANRWGRCNEVILYYNIVISRVKRPGMGL